MAPPQSPHSTLWEPHGNPKSNPRPYHKCPAPPTNTPPLFPSHPTPYNQPLWPHSGGTATSQPNPSSLSPHSQWAPRWGCCHQKGSHGPHRGAPTEWFQWGRASSRCPRCPAPAATQGAGPRVLPRHTATATLQGTGGQRGQPQPHTQLHTAPCAQRHEGAPGGLHRDKEAKVWGHRTNGGWGHRTVPRGLGDQGTGGPGDQEWHPGGLVGKQPGTRADVELTGAQWHGSMKQGRAAIRLCGALVGQTDCQKPLLGSCGTVRGHRGAP